MYSIAQQAVPNGSGQSELRRPQLTKSSSRVVNATSGAGFSFGAMTGALFISITQKTDNRISLELVSSLEEAELHQKNQRFDGGTGAVDNLGRRGRRPAGGEHAVYDERALAARQRIHMHFESIVTIFRRIFNLGGPERKLLR